MSTFVSAVFGEKPKTAPFHPLKYGEEQKKSIAGNIGAFPDISKLGDLYKSYLSDQMESLLPGWSNLLASGAKTSQETLDAAAPLLRGEIPKDIQDLVRRQSAQGALEGGFAGSNMARNLTARDFGLTSLGLMQQGANLASQGGSAAQRWAGLASNEVMNPASFFVNPQQQAQFDLQNRVLRQQSLQNQYNVSAAPNPVAKGVSDTIINLIGAYLGAGKGGGGGIAANSYSPAGTSSYNMGGGFDNTDPYNFGAYSGYGPGVA